MAYYVYILKCSDDTLYTGITTDPYSRLEKHAAGKGAKYTRSHGAKDFAAIWSSSSKSDALKLEYYLKTLSRSEKERIINDEIARFKTGEYLFLGGEGYAAKLNAAKKYLRADKTRCVDIFEAIELGLAVVERANEKGVLVYLPTLSEYFISCDDEETLKAFSSFDRKWDCVVAHHLFERDILKEKYDLKYYDNCYNVAYLKKDPPVSSAKVEIKPLTSEYAEKVKSTYKLYDASEEIDRLIAKRLMLGAFDDGVLVGFAGFHAEGAMGMLEVFPEYRRKGYGEALTIAMISLVKGLGRIPFAQIFVGNTPSVKMQEKLGFDFSEPEIVWLRKKEEK